MHSERVNSDRRSTNNNNSNSNNSRRNMTGQRTMTTTNTNTTTATTNRNNTATIPQTLWSGLETRGMRDAKCSLLLQEDAAFEPKVVTLPKQTVLVNQDTGFKSTRNGVVIGSSGAGSSVGSSNNGGGRMAPIGRGLGNGGGGSGGGMMMQSRPRRRNSDSSVDSVSTSTTSTETGDAEDILSGLPMENSTAAPTTNISSTNNYYVDFKGCTILQLEPVFSGFATQRTMPITLTVGGKCIFTRENYHNFKIMMRTKEQSKQMDIASNGIFDWPDCNSMLLCPLCGNQAPIPPTQETLERQQQMRNHYNYYGRHGDEYNDYYGTTPNNASSEDFLNNNLNSKNHEYWMLFYPLLQITVIKGTQMTLGTRTICRLTCLECMENLLEGMILTVSPGTGSSSSTSEDDDSEQPPKKSRLLRFSLPASVVLAEAGSASFLENGPSLPETYPHHSNGADSDYYYDNDVLDAWTLYNLWEHSGAWEALQNNYRIVLSKSMQGGPDVVSGDGGGTGAAPGRGSTSESNPSADNTNNNAAAINTTTTSNNKPATIGGGGGGSNSITNNNNSSSSMPSCDGYGDDSELDRNSEHTKEQQQQQQQQQQRSQTQQQSATANENTTNKKNKLIQCETCLEKKPYTQMKKCSRCRKSTYCSPECQRKAWPEHKNNCTSSSSNNNSNPTTSTTSNASSNSNKRR